MAYFQTGHFMNWMSLPYTWDKWEVIMSLKLIYILTAPSYINYIIYQKQVNEQLEMLHFEKILYPPQPEE
jgi:hypothetical protein